jgi:hypothetical protein
LDRVLRERAIVAAERLGQAPLEVPGRVEDPFGDHRRLVLEPVSAEPPGDERVVEGPHGADVVADRVVPAFPLGQRSNAPTGEQPRAQEIGDDGLRLGLVDDAAPQEMAVVRRERVDLVPLGVEREREVPFVRDPEVTVEPPLEVRRLFLEAIGVRRVVPDEPREAGTSYLRVVGVALQFAGGPGEAGQSPIPVGDRIPRVLPTLVLEPRLLVAAPIPDVAIAEEVGVVVDPGQGRSRLVLALSDQRAVAGPAFVLVQQDDVQGGGVRAAVVRGVRPLLERRHLAVAHLVEDAARVLVAEVVDAAALPVPEGLQGRRGQLGRERQRLQAGEDAVAAEHGHEPGEPGRGKAPPTGDQRREAERGQVDQAAR